MASRLLARAAAAVAAESSRRTACASSSSSTFGTAVCAAEGFAPSTGYRAFASQAARVGTGATAKAGVPPFATGHKGVFRGAAHGFGEPRAMSTSSGSGGPVGWKSLAMMSATGFGVLFFFDRERQRRLDSVRQGPVGAGKASIGGPFELKLANEKGRPFKTTELHGKYALLYFGFTMCPDICPDELEKMAECVDIVNGVVAKDKGGVDRGAKDARDKAAKVAKDTDTKGDKASTIHTEPKEDLLVPVFISIDPSRDTVQRVGEYVKEFHPKLLGLTGSVEACKAAAKQYRVYYHKTGDEDATDDYLVDHSIIMYLVDKKGEFVTFYGKNYEAKEMASAIQEQMKRLG